MSRSLLTGTDLIAMTVWGQDTWLTATASWDWGKSRLQPGRIL